MNVVKEQLAERRAEFHSYVRLLEHLEARLLPRASMRKRLGDLPSSDAFKAMKATAFLMLYNIIEATIVRAMADLYKTIEKEGCRLAEVSAKVRDLWIDQKWRIDPYSASPATYRKQAAHILKETMDGTTLVLESRKLPLSGNIDADSVRKLCDRHGVRLSVHPRARGGVELDTVKSQRNDLAHGHRTFVDCGQNYAVSDIGRISRECFNFLNGFLRSLERFGNTQGYRL